MIQTTTEAVDSYFNIQSKLAELFGQPYFDGYIEDKRNAYWRYSQMYQEVRWNTDDAVYHEDTQYSEEARSISESANLVMICIRDCFGDTGYLIFDKTKEIK